MNHKSRAKRLINDKNTFIVSLPPSAAGLINLLANTDYYSQCTEGISSKKRGILRVEEITAPAIETDARWSIGLVITVIGN
jgi:hypothetical protein